jgi:glycerol-3-phosphate O-acyltransferase/dihydroxyacetone phosphate acyltransferase
VELNRRLVQGYERYKDDPRIVELKKEVNAYNGKLKALGLRDHQVQYAKMHPITAFGLFWYRLGKLLFLSLLVLPGTLLFSLVFIVTKVVSIKKAKEALAASNVKVQARDVMATWKLLVAMAVAPMAYAWYVCLGLYWYSYNNCNGYIPAGIPKRYLILPQLIVYVTVTYGALRFGEVAMDILKSLGPLWKMMNPFSNNEVVKLQERRENLAQRVNDIINELGPEMYEDFHSKRIIEEPFTREKGEEERPITPPPHKSDEDAKVEAGQDIETYDFPTSPGSINEIPRNESFHDLANQDIFSSRPQTPKKSRSRNSSSANLGGFQLKPFSTIDGNLDEVKRRLTDGVKQRTRKRRSSGEGAWDDDEEEEGLVMGKKDRSFTR